MNPPYPSLYTGAAAPPRPERRPVVHRTAWGHERTDDYYWLNERDTPAVLEHLQAENEYAEKVLSPVKLLENELFEELKSRIRQDDASVPYFFRGYWYYVRFETGKEYPIHCRKKEWNDDATEQIILDVNQLAEGHAYCSVAGMKVSPDDNYLYFAVDYSGRNLFEIHIKHLPTGSLLPDKLPSAFGAAVWSKCSRFLFYDTKDAVTLRTDKVWRHQMGTSPETDVQVWEETDETTYASIEGSRDGEYIFINHGYTQNVETHFLPLSNPEGAFEVIEPRQEGLYYQADHHEGRFIIQSNLHGRNFSISETPVGTPEKENWKVIIAHEEDTLLDYFTVYQRFLAINVRRGGLQRIHIMEWGNGHRHDVDFGEPTYDASLIGLPDYESDILRYGFSSLKTPASVYDYTISTRTALLRKTEPVLGGYDSSLYETAFLWATAPDGTQVPVSAVFPKGIQLNGSSPCYLVGYGSYGICYDPAFNRNLISLMERGFVCAIAHVRGGMEMGFAWYEQGKLMQKTNTFTDFIACAEMLIAEGYTAPDRLFVQGGSAGGLLMGAVANLRPDLFKGVIASVPFVDVVTTMSDPDIPLTTGEYPEWGNPENQAAYQYMLGYSPYDQVKAQEYPYMLIKTSYADSQVQYFEPAKWTARLRDLKTDSKPVLFITNMSGSHGGASGRFERLKDKAQEFAWMLALLPVKTPDED